MTLLWKFVIFIALCKAVCMVPDTVADSVNSSPCEDGWEPYGDKYCSKIFWIHKNWPDASNSCIDNGGYLASIHSKEQNDIIPYSVKDYRWEPLWIGMYVDLNDKYVWVDGTKVDYTNWGSTERDEEYLSGECVIDDLLYRIWSVYPCDSEFPYICQKKAATIVSTSTGIDNRQVCMVPDTVADNVNSSPCEDGWEPYGDEYCWKLFSSHMNWLDASNSCIDNGGYLASIHSKEQNDIIQYSVNYYRWKTLWIGLYVDLNDKYVWVDGTQVDYTNWADGQPDGGYIPGDCVIVSSTHIGMWLVFPCSIEFFYICQKKVTTTSIMRTEVNNIPGLISVTTYIIIVIVILLLALIGGILYYKRIWIQEKRLNVAAIFFRKS